MGRTRDVLFVRLKEEYKTKEYNDLVKEVPEPYKEMFSLIWNELQDLEAMLDKDNILRMLIILYPPHSKTVEKYPPIYSEYRESSFQKMIYESFFEPIMIYKNIADHQFYLECTIYNVVYERGVIDFKIEEKYGRDRYNAMHDIDINNLISKEEYEQKESEEFLEIKSRRDIVDLEVEEPFVYLP